MYAFIYIYVYSVNIVYTMIYIYIYICVYIYVYIYTSHIYIYIEIYASFHLFADFATVWYRETMKIQATPRDFRSRKTVFSPCLVQSSPVRHQCAELPLLLLLLLLLQRRGLKEQKTATWMRTYIHTL